MLKKDMSYLPLIGQLFRFGLVGVAAAAIHLLIVIALVQCVLLPPLIANIFAFAISFQASYWGHRRFTFYAANTAHSVALPRLLLVQLLNFAANESLFSIFLAFSLPYPLALVIVLTVLPMFTFISSKFWIFR